ncbi:MAG: hypothetical protein J7M38_00825, partial [Armatimonadetes bacterium]|nr:hypothetical protein [Armatimonadota bacterium]
MRLRWAGALTAAVWLVATAVAAQNTEQIHSVTPAQAAVCVTVDGPINVDGTLDDPAWQAAIPFSGFTYSTHGDMAVNTTRVMIVCDAEAVYFGVRCSESHMEKLKADKVSRDSSIWNDDCIELFLDLKHQHRTFTQLVVNSVPALFDARDGSATWDGEWQAGASTDDRGWTVEIRVPFATLGVPPPPPGTIWGLNVCRERQTEQRKELHNWADVQGNFHRPWLFGHLYFAGPRFEMTDAVAKGLFAEIG